VPGPLLHNLAYVARRAREDAGLRQIDIATRAGVNHATISAFERALVWPQDPERTIEAYAAETGREARALWAEALRGWT
jgi:transcriptional regulator with XRE-family HTH domain